MGAIAAPVGAGGDRSNCHVDAQVVMKSPACCSTVVGDDAGAFTAGQGDGGRAGLSVAADKRKEGQVTTDE